MKLPPSLSSAYDRRLRRRSLVAFGCFLVLMTGPAHAAVSWKHVGTVTTLTGNQLCYTDGANVICDSSAPTLSGTSIGIGTTSPTGILQTVQTINGPMYGVSATGAVGDVTLGLNNSGTGGAFWYLDSTNNTSGLSGGNLAIGYGSWNNVMTLTNAGNVGIGTTAPQNLLDVNGAVSIGYNVAAPSNSLIVNGKVGIGTTVPLLPFQDFAMGMASGANNILSFNSYWSGATYSSLEAGYSAMLWQDTATGILHVAVNNNNASGAGQAITYSYPLNIMSAGVGVGTSTIASKFEVNGNASIGYADTAAPTNGLIVSGNVGIGTTSTPTGVKASVNGIVQVAGTGSEACTAAQVGSIRYNPTGNYFELCSYP